jgi:hypothetical protein
MTRSSAFGASVPIQSLWQYFWLITASLLVVTGFSSGCTTNHSSPGARTITPYLPDEELTAPRSPPTFRVLSRLVRRWGQCEGSTDRDALAQTRARLGNARMARNLAGSDSSRRLSLSASFLNRSTYREVRFGVPLYASRFTASAVYLSPGHAFKESSNRDRRARQVGH